MNNQSQGNAVTRVSQEISSVSPRIDSLENTTAFHFFNLRPKQKFPGMGAASSDNGHLCIRPIVPTRMTRKSWKLLKICLKPLESYQGGQYMRKSSIFCTKIPTEALASLEAAYR